MRRVLVTGNAGSGKTTAAQQLSSQLNLELHHLDQVVWKKGWEPVSKVERNRCIENITQNPEWVIDGVSLRAMEKADTILFLDLHIFHCLVRVLFRALRFRMKTRPEMPPDCPELQGVFKAMRLVCLFPFKTRPVLVEYLKTLKNKEIVHIKHRNELKEYLVRSRSPSPNSLPPLHHPIAP